MRTRPTPNLLVADDQGRFYDHPGLSMAGRSWDLDQPVTGRDTLAAPDGLQMVFLPGRLPVGIDPVTSRPVTVECFEADGREFTPHAVAAVLPPGLLRHLLPAARTTDRAPSLPLRAYTAVGIQDDSLRVAASRIDPHTHWDPARFEDPNLEESISRMLRRFEGNQVVRQLARCAREYFCSTARNIFLGTFEGALPVAPLCNSRCLGCISAQDGPVDSPQKRLVEPPAVEQIVALAVHHLKRASPAMVSFGQGCEGEPLTRADLIAQAIERIRSHTSAGTIHMNTNGSRPEALDALAAAGLQSVRVSLASARPEAFSAYHRGDFGLGQVEGFTARAVDAGLFVSLNLLVFPGFTDRESELDALVGLLGRTKAHMVQMRNLDLDPDRFLSAMEPAGGEPLGMRTFVRELRRRVPGIELGSFNRFLS